MTTKPATAAPATAEIKGSVLVRSRRRSSGRAALGTNRKTPGIAPPKTTSVAAAASGVHCPEKARGGQGHQSEPESGATGASRRDGRGRGGDARPAEYQDEGPGRPGPQPGQPRREQAERRPVPSAARRSGVVRRGAA